MTLWKRPEFDFKANQRTRPRHPKRIGLAVLRRAIGYDT